MQVLALSIIFMAVSVIIQIGLPVFLFIYFYKKFNAKFLPMILGALGFIIFALVLESLIHRLVFNNFAIREKPAIYIIYGVLMAGIFEESARFIIFNVLKKKYDGIGTALSYGVGHGGIESALLGGVSMISAIVVSFVINSGNIETLTGKLEGDAFVAMLTQMGALITSPSYMFLISGFERLFAVFIQISLSVIVFYSVYNKKLQLFFFAILLHAIIDIPAAAFQVGLIKNIYVVEGIVLLSAAGVTILAWLIHKKEKPAEIKSE